MSTPAPPLALSCCMIRITYFKDLKGWDHRAEHPSHFDNAMLDPSGSVANEKLISWFNNPTPSSYLDRIDTFTEKFWDVVQSYKSSECQTSGFEIYNKLGLIVKPHFHFAFPTRTPKETIRKALSRAFDVKGNNTYCIQIEPIDTGDSRRLMYGCKQMPLLKYSSHPALDELIRQAKSEYKAVINSASKRTEKKENNCLQDRLHEALLHVIKVQHFRAKNRSTDKIYQRLWKEAVLFYMKEKRDTSLFTLKDKILVFMVKEKLISMDELFRRFHKD